MTDLFNQPELTGAELRDKGMTQAVDHANEVNENWSEKAYEILIKYITFNKEFMVEELREFAEPFISQPPSKRAWGSVVVRAKRDGLIYSTGTRTVTNPKAHRANANVWFVV